jgi:hypothetical protein
VWAKHVRPVLGGYRLRDVSPGVVDEFKASLIGSGVGLPTVRKALALVSGMFAAQIGDSTETTLKTYVHVFEEFDPASRVTAVEAIEAARAEVDVRGEYADGDDDEDAESRKPASVLEADARTRTADPFITSEVLYQLSYVGAPRIVGTPPAPSRARHDAVRAKAISPAVATSRRRRSSAPTAGRSLHLDLAEHHSQLDMRLRQRWTSEGRTCPLATAGESEVAAPVVHHSAAGRPRPRRTPTG